MPKLTLDQIDELKHLTERALNKVEAELAEALKVGATVGRLAMLEDCVVTLEKLQDALEVN